jgi:hopene-associated glycosyltransferase HpnB
LQGRLHSIDEASVIESTLRALRRLDYPGKLLILLVDDGSRDATAALAANTAAGSGHPLEIIPGKPLPAGWTGKLWAMSRGVEKSSQETPAPRYSWFCDADIEHDPEVLRALVWKAEKDSLSLVSTMAQLHCASIWEKLLIPAFVFYFRKLYPFRLVNTPRHPMAAAAGGSMLVRLAALAHAGGLERIKSEWIDDCALARLIKPNGGIWLGMTTLSRSIRSYRFADIWRMVARSAYTQLRHSLLWLAAAVSGMLFLSVAPPPAC